MNCIGISGKICSGKSTLAEAIIAQYPEYKVMSLAGMLKQEIADLYGLTRADIEERKDLFRPMLQHHGQILRALHGPDYLMKKVFTTAESLGYINVIIDDIRFPDEVTNLRKLANTSKLVRLYVSPELQKERYAKKYKAQPDTEKLNHITETALDDMPRSTFDFYFDSGEASPEDMLCVVTRPNMSLKEMGEAAPHMVVIDIDACVADLWGAINIQRELDGLTLMEHPESYHMSPDTEEGAYAIAKFNDMQFYANAMPLDGALKGVWDLYHAGYEIVFLTARGTWNEDNAELAEHITKEWLSESGFPPHRLVFRPSDKKAAWCGSRRYEIAFVVEDSPSTAEALAEKRILTYIVSYPYNTYVPEGEYIKFVSSIGDIPALYAGIQNKEVQYVG